MNKKWLIELGDLLIIILCIGVTTVGIIILFKTVDNRQYHTEPIPSVRVYQTNINEQNYIIFISKRGEMQVIHGTNTLIKGNSLPPKDK